MFMVIERFPKGIEVVGERFRASGRQMPDDVHYIASWLTPGGDMCYQVMEAPNLASLQPWIDAWQDLVDFEIQQVTTSAEFWAARTRRAPELTEE